MSILYHMTILIFFQSIQNDLNIILLFIYLGPVSSLAPKLYKGE